MKQSTYYRENSENCLRLAGTETSAPQRKRYERMAQAWAVLTVEQEWLDGEAPRTEVKPAGNGEHSIPRITTRSWTPDQNEQLIALAKSGASIMRASAALKRSSMAVRSQGHKLGVKFKTINERRRAIKEKRNDPHP